MLAHSNLLHNSAVIHRVSQHRPHDNGVFWLPPFHDMGLIGGILQPIYAGLSGGADVAGHLPAAAAALAGGDVALRRDDERRAELRLRPVRRAHRRRGAGVAGSLALAHVVQRRRADSRRHDRAVLSRIRGERAATRRDPALLRTRRRNAPRLGWAGRTRPSGRARRSARAGVGGAARTRGGWGQSSRPRGVGRTGRRAAGRHRRSRYRRTLGRRTGGRDLGRWSKRGRGLLGPARRDRRHLPGAPRRLGFTLHADRRPWRARAGTAHRHRATQGPRHPRRPQLLPARHRAGRGAQSRQSASGIHRGVRRRRGGSRAARAGGRGGTAAQAGGRPGAVPGDSHRARRHDRHRARRDRADPAEHDSSHVEREDPAARLPRGLPRRIARGGGPLEEPRQRRRGARRMRSRRS